MNHIMCLISTIKCSAKVLKLIECIKLVTIIFTLVISSFYTIKLLTDRKVRSLMKID